jgi:hypothetical protein
MELNLRMMIEKQERILRQKSEEMLIKSSKRMERMMSVPYGEAGTELDVEGNGIIEGPKAMELNEGKDKRDETGHECKWSLTGELQEAAWKRNMARRMPDTLQRSAGLSTATLSEQMPIDPGNYSEWLAKPACLQGVLARQIPDHHQRRCPPRTYLGISSIMK